MAMHGLAGAGDRPRPAGQRQHRAGIEHSSGTPSIYEVLVDGMPLDEVTVPGRAGADLWGRAGDHRPRRRRDRARLGRRPRAPAAPAIAAYGREVDYILVDCPPSLGLLTVNALVAGDEVLIPIQCEYYALEGLGQLLNNIELIKSHLNGGLQISTILLTMYDGRTKLADQVAQEVRNHFGDLVLDVVIPRSVRVSEAPGYGQSVMTYDPGSRGALTYYEAAREMAERGTRMEPVVGGVAGAGPSQERRPRESE
jgi:chromosome partitioning protein